MLFKKSTQNDKDNYRQIVKNHSFLNNIHLLIVYWCIIQTGNSLPKIYPIHNGLDTTTVPVPSPGPCYPDQVYINDTFVNSHQDYVPTIYNNKCIKCTQFAPTAQKCTINSIRTQIISIIVTQQFYDKTTTNTEFKCLESNGYKINSSKICGNQVIGAILWNGSNRGDCFSTMPNCYICHNYTSCRQCKFGYYIKNMSPNNLCQPLNSLNPNCMKVNDNNPKMCIACQTGYYVYYNSGSDYSCKQCLGNCSECDNSSGTFKCTKCKHGFQYLNDNCLLEPFPCNTSRPTCNQCISRKAPSGQSFIQCISCHDPSTQYLNRQGTKCIKNCTIAQPHCQLCYTSKIDNLPKCRKCLQGFYVNWHGGCQSCQAPIPYCAKCQHSQKCNQCMMKMAYLKSNTQCQLCSVIITNCLLCQKNLSGVVQCLKCSQGYYVEPSKISCTNCPPQCRVCTDANTCISCKSSPKYYLDPSDNMCKNCSNSIIDCAQCNTKLKNPQCLFCINDRALYPQPTTGKMICGPCSQIDANCISCKKGNLCTACNNTSGTYLQKSSNTCSPCLLPCSTCQTKFKCLTCSETYLVIFDNAKGKCEPCWNKINNCLQCSFNTSLGFIQCTKCKPLYIPQTNSNYSSQCKICQQNQYPSYSPVVRCEACVGKCLACHNATSCKSCIGAYYGRLIAYNTVQCIDRCGDQSLIYLPCDLWKGNMSDGCTSQCQVQKDFICQIYFSINNTQVADKNDKVTLQNYIDNLPRHSNQHYYSICSYNGSVKMTVNKIMKQRFENKISFQIKLTPFLHVYTLLTEQEVNSLITATYQTISLPQQLITTKLSQKNQSIIVTIVQPQSFLQPLTLTLSHNNITITDNRKFKYTTDSFIQLNTKDQRSLSAFYYIDGDLKLWGIVHLTMQIVSVFALICAFGSIILKNLAGLELLWILQSMYVSLFWYQQPLSLPLYSLAGLSLSHGYNTQSQITRTYQTQTINSTRLLYTYRATSGHFSSMFVQIPNMVFLFLLMYFLSYFGWVCKDMKNPKVKKWSKYFQQFFYNDGLLIVAMFQLLNSLHQAFLLKQNWTIISPQSQFFGTILTFSGLCCMLMIFIKWFSTKHLGYEKVEQNIIPYELFFSPFHRHNFPILRQKFYSLYIIMMILTSVACAFGGFYPMIPCLLYVLLAFLIEFYQPYSKKFSNHRAAYYSLVIGYGYFLRVIYLFNYDQKSSTINGIVQHNLWTIWVWIVALFFAFVLFLFDVTSTYRENQKQRQKLQQQFKLNLQRQDKQFEMKLLEQQAKKYMSHKGNLQSVLYPKISSQKKKQAKNNVLIDQESPQQKVNAMTIKKKVNQSNSNINNKNNIKNNKNINKKIKPEYISINNNKNKNITKRLYQDDLQQVIIDEQTLGNKQWLLDKKKTIDQQKLRKQQQKLDGYIKLAYGIVSVIFENKQKIIQQQKQFQMMTIKQRLVKQRVQEQYERHFDNPDKEKKPQIELQQIFNKKQIKQQHLDKYKLQKAVDKHKPIHSRQRNFPHVEIYYQKAKKLTYKQLQQAMLKRQKQLNQQGFQKKNKSNNIKSQPQSSSSQPETIKLNKLKAKLKIKTNDNETEE